MYLLLKIGEFSLSCHFPGGVIGKNMSMVAIVDRQKVLHELISNIGRHAAVSMDVFSAMYTFDLQQNPSELWTSHLEVAIFSTKRIGVM